MVLISSYLYFPGTALNAFQFYSSIFKSSIMEPGPIYYQDMPKLLGKESYSKDDQKRIAHIELSILDNHLLMGADLLKTDEASVRYGTNIFINIQPATKSEMRRIFNALSKNGNIITPLQQMPWGGFVGKCTDSFSINWMLNCEAKTPE